MPLLFESRAERFMSRVVVVRCDRAAQLARLRRRNGLSEADAEARVAAQMPQDDKVARADYVIDNSGSKEAALEQVCPLARIHGARAHARPNAVCLARTCNASDANVRCVSGRARRQVKGATPPLAQAEILRAPVRVKAGRFPADCRTSAACDAAWRPLQVQAVISSIRKRSWLHRLLPLFLLAVPLAAIVAAVRA